ncbi:LysR family transcriptional regulator [Streptomyces huiliensis]|uniref:LysR family transcriptional regulator n=1 Tax=Streptomyces huiliensis TaxID=2876027 RepID=UPI001CC037FF|nr:LysR substrate-binding domain-containing protein [Streptomyces huiliensis]MBZ4321230.1 LysR family transcriptional regulator [Streptomyces huiliensis]
MDVRRLEYFLAVVDRGGFHRAAAALYVAQPSLSQAVRALERELGTELFHRIGRRVVLTEAGRALVGPARAAVRSLEVARASVASVRELRTGRLDVAAMPSQAVEPLTSLIRAFTRRHPGVTVAVRAVPTARGVVEAVRTGAAELGLLASADPLSGDEVAAYELGEQRFVLVVPPDGPFEGRRSVRCEELAGRRLVLGQPGTGMRAYTDSLRERGVDFTAAAETEHRAALLPMVLAGVGLAVVTEAWREFALRTGARVLDIEPAAALRVALVARRGPLSPAAAAFMATAVPPPPPDPEP